MRVVDATGNIADSYNYSEWEVQSVTTNNFPQPFGYLGAYTNSATGLVHLGARFYDPTLGRFTQQHPSTHPGDVNQSSPCTYAGDDPINHTDLSGLDFLSGFLGVTATVLSIGAGVADAVGAAPVGLVLGAGAIAADAGKTSDDCEGDGSGNCGGDLTGDAVGVATFGTGLGAGAAGADDVALESDAVGAGSEIPDDSGAYDDNE